MSNTAESQAAFFHLQRARRSLISLHTTSEVRGFLFPFHRWDASEAHTSACGHRCCYSDLGMGLVPQISFLGAGSPGARHPATSSDLTCAREQRGSAVVLMWAQRWWPAAHLAFNAVVCNHFSFNTMCASVMDTINTLHHEGRHSPHSQ